MHRFHQIKTILLVSLLVAVTVPGLFLIKGLVTGYQHAWRDAFSGMIYSFLITFLIYITNMNIYFRLHKKFPWKTYPVKRLTIELVSTSLSAAFIISVVLIPLNKIIPIIPYSQLAEEIIDNIIVAIIINFIIIAFLEGIYFFSEWKESLIESEKLKRQNMEMQYSALSSQLNPHFLFNSLNTLSSLIPVDSTKAVEFTNRFSKIYRYVLDVRDKFVVKLSDELNFLENYAFLQKIRYGENLQISVKIDPALLNTFIPPLSLQLLVENAIKHNEISKQNPLTITIQNNDTYLIVKNNFHPRLDKEPSAGIGIINLKERYSHYTTVTPEFQISNDLYIAKMPILSDDE